MYFNKIPYSNNFRYPTDDDVVKDGAHLKWPNRRLVAGKPMDDSLQLQLDSFGDVHRIRVTGPQWGSNDSQLELDLPEKTQGIDSRIKLGQDLSLNIFNARGESLLQSVPNQSFGVCGEAHLFQFFKPDNSNFYGLGEKMLGLELSKVRTKFWNTDVWADFDHAVFSEGHPDPLYASIPYLIVRTPAGWVGLLLNNPHASFISTDGNINIAGQMDASEQSRESLILGSQQGQPELFIIVAKTLADLTCRYQKLIGTTPLPPVWSLGYHQCRWGYESMADLESLDRGMEENNIPCDGLWLDIEYMKGYRVFTFEPDFFPDPTSNFASINAKGRKVVPIIDPGVKAENGYEVYDSGQTGSHFCKNPNGDNFIGLVWPGETAFPDFSQKATRDWWATWTRRFAENGIHGAWLDMNDPSTGFALNEQMLFADGSLPHSSFHNQYANGMAQATREGFLKAHPEERPFLLSRSAFTGMARYSALWTGDNVSNDHYLKQSIPCSINLALSGIPFNGPDVGGFGGDTNPDLLIRWIKAGFLFPFLRNHSIRGSRQQEPWAFDTETTQLYAKFVRLRYRLRPYLYQLFIEQEEHGQAILRPLFYDHEQDTELGLETCEDQFMIGADLMQAPFLEEGQKERQVILPGSHWYNPFENKWHEGQQKITVYSDQENTPLFFRLGAIIPGSRNEGGDNTYRGHEVDFHLILKKGLDQNTEATYHFDDGVSFAYQDGQRSSIQVIAQTKGNHLNIETRVMSEGTGPADLRFIVYEPFDTVSCDGKTIELIEMSGNIFGNHRAWLAIPSS